MFDARSAKQLQPGDHLTVGDAPGLRLIATTTTKAWTYRFRSPVDGKLRQMKLGLWPAMGLPAALAAWERVRNERATGADPVQQKREKRAAKAAAAAQATYTVRALCDEFLTAYQGTVAPRTYTEHARLLARELDGLEALPAASVTRAAAFDLIDAMRDRPVVAKMLRRALGAAWDYGLDSGRLPPETPNWWRLVLRGKLPSKGKVIGGENIGATKRVLSEPEVAELLAWLPNFSRDVEDALTLYLWTACRGAEIVAMERNELAAEGDTLWWTVPREKLKMRRNPLTVDLRVPLVGRARSVVERRLAATTGPFLFRSPGVKNKGHITQKAVGVAVWSHMPYSETRPQWVRPRLPVTHWAPHDLRRTARTVLASLGCPGEISEAILGHQPPGVQGIYNRYQYDAERLTWLSRLADRWESLGRR